MPLKSDEDDEEDICTLSGCKPRAVAKEINVDAAVTAVLLGLHNIVALKGEELVW